MFKKYLFNTLGFCLIAIIGFTFIFGYNQNVQAASNPGIVFGINTNTYWEDGIMKTALTKPSLNNDTTYIPLRLVSEYLGKTVKWNQDDFSATISDLTTGKWIIFDQKYNYATTETGENIQLKRNPFIQDECYMVPLRIMSEYFGCSVYWHQDTEGIIINKAPTEQEKISYQGLVMRFQDRGYFQDGLGKEALTKLEIFNGTSYLPLRIVSEYLGAKVTWNEADDTATLTMPESTKTITFNKASIYATTDSGNIQLERAPFVQDDCYMVPARIITEFFGCTITWNQDMMSFLITKTDTPQDAKNLVFSQMQNRLAIINTLTSFRQSEATGYQMVINRTNPIPANFIAGTGKLISVRGQQMETNAGIALQQMINGLSAANMSIQVRSGYRTDATQIYLYNRQVGRQGNNRLKAATISALPFTSEHQAGLAIDLSSNGSLTEAFGSTKQGKWLAAHCADYGFIVRYPQSKTQITGVTWEPWHFRYVGSPEVAKSITASGLCMEEYYNKYLAPQDINPYLPYL
ncbi:MAG: stalk domain-containing protein [Clostridiales bacterium]